MLKIGKTIVKLREEAGYNQSKFAQELRIPSTTLSNYERGEREISHEWLIKFATFFDVSVDYLLGLTESERETATRNEVFLEINNKRITNAEFCTKLSVLPPKNKEIVYEIVESFAR